ncbi:MAG: 6,7-dimethyl-8-ribityllumazine synthase [Gemmatimonadetes bacterium]|nr:6,7-dimethyl-8-ribityllumazine synthase [Gemmatimonadota bacterium]
MAPRTRSRRNHTRNPRALVVVARFNEGVTRKLLDGAVAELATAGYPADRVDVVWVPGAFELPLAVQAGLEAGSYSVAVALGAVIRGETPHFEYLCAEATRGLGEAALRFATPVGFGVLTCDTLEQALARAGGDAGNKGAEAAAAAVETARMLASLAAGRGRGRKRAAPG